MINSVKQSTKSKPKGELLTWENLSNMNYTWEVALKTLRMFPLLFGGFRKAVKDTECGGYIIPEGWQLNSPFDPTRLSHLTALFRSEQGIQHSLQVKDYQSKSCQSINVTDAGAEKSLMGITKVKQINMETHWKGKQEITVLPLMKKLSFDVICSLLFGIEQGGTRRDKLVTWFQQMIGGIWSVPINLPFTRFNRGLRASARVRNFLKDLIAENRMELKKGADPHQDLITCLLSTRHDTSAILITFMIRLLAIEPSIYAAVLQEQEGIAKSKPRGELLTWEDLAKMKYTWKVALETLRMFPPIFGGFRKAVRDIEYNGYIIPKGWQIFWTMNMTHMDDSIFTEPSKFDPTRFDNQASIPPYSFIAFGGGPRMCPGYEFAKIEALMMEGVWSIPFTSYNRSLQASARIRDMGKDLIGHDTSSILVTFLIRLLANEPSIYAAILN
ncbi:hypothetical protein POTOM_003244 [Populus tomentosa]|uniref:Uncharacterized protein n=1 Tax=Populus tomentosa TaxID=118781 RepID=A0A8X8IY53_POPTO|nr:hypothetical protein POTOM_003244 [Populus tomentosa]